MEESYLNELVQKYAKGTASEEERNVLLAWYRDNSDNGHILPYESEEEELSAKEEMLIRLQKQMSHLQPAGRSMKHFYIRLATAAAVITGILIVFLGVKTKYGQSNRGAYITVKTSPAEHKIITLSDGTKIWLSPKSLLKFPNDFSGETREVAFEGEAFFDVHKDKAHPFIVHTGPTFTRVLGTTFNITALKEQKEITVALLTGKVAFTDGAHELMLSPGYQIHYNKADHRTEMLSIPDMQALLKRRIGDYEYNNVRVADVVADINQNFDAHIKIEGKVKDCLFFGRLKPGEALSVFLKGLAIVNKAELIQTNNGFIIKGGGCENDLK